ncbi:MAG: metal ABC transporter ATP-binding protein [Synergistaceae bacterium]|jgi:zinc transport system ATP-binding protein|nr:metal ABC transporter ATP-binding protein [Synergistaceae bacterium]
MALITCRDASFAYDGNVVVSELNFEVRRGDYLCIVGENGSGKSTLIKGLLRLLPPHSGSVTAGDGLGPGEVGCLPQQASVQKDFPASAYEVVLSGRLASRGIFPFYSKADRTAALENMERFGVHDLRRRCYRELSGGQRQRVLLARALCAAKKILILDEPAAGLDPVATQELYRLTETLNRETGIAIVMVSHDIASAVKYATHILQLKNAQIFFGETEDYLSSDIGGRFVRGERK